MNPINHNAAVPSRPPPCFDGLCEHDIHHACALRFDGDRYFKTTGFDAEAAVRTRHNSSAMPDSPSRLDLLAMYFVLHGQIYANGFSHASTNGRTWHLLRLFFMYSETVSVPDEYRPTDLTWHHRWENCYLPRWRDVHGFIHSSFFYKVPPEQFAETHESYTRYLRENGATS